MPIASGNVTQTSLVEIYRDSPLFRDLRRPDTFAGRCGRCEFRYVCGGSRSRAYAVTGSPLGEEPFCTYQPTDAAKKARDEKKATEAGQVKVHR